MVKVRVLVVDDAVVIRRMVTESLNRDPDFEVVGVASNGKIALQKITQVNPDAITLDVEMPIMDGLETVREIRKTHPSLPIIMFSTLTERGGAATLEALSLGANDYVTKPANVSNVAEGLERLRNQLIPKLRVHCAKLLPSEKTLSSLPLNAKRRSAPRRPSNRKPQILCIGTSTGGPNALAQFFELMTVRLTVPVVIVQHMPPMFTKLLAERINKLSPNSCCEAEDGQVLKAGNMYIAPGGKHMELRREGNEVRVELNEKPPENSCRPAVDVLFRSVAACYGSAVLGVILTGMGRDGFNGSETLVDAGGRVLAQDEASSVVWGMPGYVAQAGLADKVLPLIELPAEILKTVDSRTVAKVGI
ncbi:MAG: two-component system chemotaxis response regulator CheB [Candidatus Pelagisphaera sp.]|jgi:two-component system chemotaxis response regulator CheB